MQHKNNLTKTTLFLLVGLLIVGFLFFSEKPPDSPQKDVLSLSNCTRTDPYSKPPEFDRAVSLILQRQKQKKHPYSQKFEEMKNCLDIQYTDLSSENGAEGVFYFDDSVSSVNKLVLEVDRNYQFTDDITTAYLLSHELSHARQFTETVSGEKSWGCLEAEVEAFYEQLVFGSLLNEEEVQSVISRLEGGSTNTQLKQYEHLLDISWQSIQECKNTDSYGESTTDFACWQGKVRDRIEVMVRSNPFYQEQCKGTSGDV